METRKLLQEVLLYIEENVTHKLTIEEIAHHVYLSPVHLQRIFSFVFDIPLAEYVRSRKMQKALTMLYESDDKISDIAYNIGFCHESSFIRSFKREFGVTPSEVRKHAPILESKPPLTVPAGSQNKCS